MTEKISLQELTDLVEEFNRQNPSWHIAFELIRKKKPDDTDTNVGTIQKPNTPKSGELKSTIKKSLQVVEKPNKTTTAPGPVKAKRQCAVCDKELSGRSITCSPGCKKEYGRRKKKQYNDKYTAKKRAEKDSRINKDPKKPKPEINKKDKPQRKYRSVAQEASAIPKRQKYPEREKVERELKTNPVKYDDFDDPWDCAVCRNAHSLCLMHENMQRDGASPPKFRQTIGNKSQSGL